MTPDLFERRLQQDLAIQQVSGAIEASVAVPKSVVDRFATLVAQKRQVRPMIFRPAGYAAKVQLAPDAVQKEYDAHADQFMTVESAKVEYAVLSADAMARQVTVPEADARAFYDQNRKRYEIPEQRRASHILVAVSKDASDADKAKAKAKAEDVLKKVRANPADFPKLAKQYSDDPGSAANGGDLDFLGRGATVPPFEAALFALKDKEISDLVLSDFGYHIIELTGVKPAQVKPYEAVKGEIDAEIGKQLAQKKYQDAAEAFANGVYEQADALAPTAQKFGIAVQTADNVPRTAAPNADPTSPLSNAKLLTALFSADSIKSRHNTEAVETQPGTLVAARLLDYKPAVKRPLAEVADGIKARLVNAEAAKLADAAGRARLAQLQKGDAAAKSESPAFGNVVSVSRVERSDVPPEATTEIFRTDATKLPAYAGVALSTGEYAVYAIDSVTTVPDADPTRRTQLVQSIAKQLGAIELDAYTADLRRRAKVKVSPPYADLIEKRDAAKTAG